MSARRVGGSVGVRLKGIGAAARELGVNASHLRLVVTGERRSDRLLARVSAGFPGLLGPGGRVWNEVLGRPTWRDAAK